MFCSSSSAHALCHCPCDGFALILTTEEWARGVGTPNTGRRYDEFTLSRQPDCCALPGTDNRNLRDCIVGAGRWNDARALHYKLYRLFSDLFIDTNPVPVKAALAMMGKMEETYRLPLCETTEANRKKIAECLRELKLI